MTTTYTTAALVREQIHHISSDLSDSDIEAMINMAESLVDSVMRTSGINSPSFEFSSSKHGLIRMATTLAAAFQVMSSDVEEYTSSSMVIAQANLIYTLLQVCLDKLSDSRTVSYLTNL
jgi:hypothetical protein